MSSRGGRARQGKTGGGAATTASAAQRSSRWRDVEAARGNVRIAQKQGWPRDLQANLRARVREVETDARNRITPETAQKEYVRLADRFHADPTTFRSVQADVQALRSQLGHAREQLASEADRAKADALLTQILGLREAVRNPSTDTAKRWLSEYKPTSRSRTSGGRAKATGEKAPRAPKAESVATSATPKPPRQTLTSARAQLRDLTSKVNAANANVDRAVNAPRDTQDFSRSYRAWQAAIEERDRFFNSLTPEMAAKLRSSEPTPRGSSSGTGTARLNVRASTYNGQSGFTIRGTDTLGRSVSIFSTSRAEAERMRNQIKAGQEPTFDKQRKGA